jgi:hypothetical protein
MPNPRKIACRWLLVLTVWVVGSLAQAQAARREIENQGTTKSVVPEDKPQVESENVKVLLEIFCAVEDRDDKRFQELCDPQFEIHSYRPIPASGQEACSCAEVLLRHHSGCRLSRQSLWEVDRPNALSVYFKSSSARL